MANRWLYGDVTLNSSITGTLADATMMVGNDVVNVASGFFDVTCQFMFYTSNNSNEVRFYARTSQGSQTWTTSGNDQWIGAVACVGSALNTSPPFAVLAGNGPPPEFRPLVYNAHGASIGSVTCIIRGSHVNSSA